MPNPPLGSYTDADWQRVGAAISERMAELGLTQTDLSRRADVSDMTIRPLQYGEAGNYRDATLSKVCRALNWPHDAIRRILAGTEAIHLEPTEPTEPTSSSYDERIRKLSPDARRMIDGLIDLAEREDNGDSGNGSRGRTEGSPVAG